MIVDEIREAVESGRVTRRRIALEAGVTPATITNLLKGAHGLRVVTADKLRGALDRLAAAEGREPLGPREVSKDVSERPVAAGCESGSGRSSVPAQSPVPGREAACEGGDGCGAGSAGGSSGSAVGGSSS